MIGGGIAGLSLAWELAAAGASVTLFEAGRLGERGASALPAALLNPYRGRTARARPLDRAGLEAFWGLHDTLATLGHPSGATRSGVLRIPSKARQARDWHALAEADDGLAWLAPDDVPPPLHAPHGALRVVRGGWVRPRTLLAALAAAARTAGASLLEDARVEAIAHRPGGVLVTGAWGERTSDVAVLCLGASPAPAGVAPPPLERVEGDIVRLEAPPLPLPLAGAVYALSDGAGVLVGGNHRPIGRADPDGPALLRRSLGWFAPPMADAPIADVWRGVRARREGNRPLLARLGERVWMLGALAGRGFLCGPLLARSLTRSLLDGEEPDAALG